VTEPRRVIVIFDSLSTVHQQEIITWLGRFGAGWAKWLSTAMFVAPSGGSPTFAELREKILSFSPRPNFFMLEVSDITQLTAVMPAQLSDGAKKWLREQWSLSVEE